MSFDITAVLANFFGRHIGYVLLDLADILLVSFIVYRTLVLIRGTRAMQMGIGLALLFVAYELARRFGLATVFTLLDTVVTYLVLIVVVIFQNDIRRALMRFGRRPFFRPGGPQDTHVFEEVIKAVTQLAQKRVGALIVLERDAALDEFIEPGTRLDAAVSKELLFSIFIPSFQNPMHDGAVVIREGRVAQAGAFLPLPAGTKLDRRFGTRHRAAIGITEETDAVAIVVSEERGSVSLCDHGNIIRDLDPDSLREALVGLFHRTQARSGPAVVAAVRASEPGTRSKVISGRPVTEAVADGSAGAADDETDEGTQTSAVVAAPRSRAATPADVAIEPAKDTLPSEARAEVDAGEARRASSEAGLPAVAAQRGDAAARRDPSEPSPRSVEGDDVAQTDRPRGPKLASFLGDLDRGPVSEEGGPPSGKTPPAAAEEEGSPP